MAMHPTRQRDGDGAMAERLRKRMKRQLLAFQPESSGELSEFLELYGPEHGAHADLVGTR
jgi:hypothetical protein